MSVNIDVTKAGVPQKGTAPYILAQSAVPTILPSSGSSNATGVITFTTALPYTLATGQACFVYLPAGVVTAGSQGTGAGVYAATGLNTNNTVQISGTGIVTANGAYTQTTGSDLTLATVTVPGGAMGANGAFRHMVKMSRPNNANACTTKTKLSTATLFNNAAPNCASFCGVMTVLNRGSQSAQIYGPGLSDGSSGSTTALSTSSIDMSTDKALTYTGQLAVAADYLILEGYTVEVLPG